MLFHRAQDQRDGAQVCLIVVAKIFKIISIANMSIIITNIISAIIWKICQAHQNRQNHLPPLRACSRRWRSWWMPSWPRPGTKSSSSSSSSIISTMTLIVSCQGVHRRRGGQLLWWESVPCTQGEPISWQNKLNFAPRCWWGCWSPWPPLPSTSSAPARLRGEDDEVLDSFDSDLQFFMIKGPQYSHL